MKRKIFLLSLSIFLIISGLNIVKSCGDREDTVNCFPDNIIDVVLNLNLPAYQELQYTGGWIYVNEQSSGSRGLIVVRTNNGFKAYDRNAPHICPDSNTTLNVVDDIKIECPKDGAEWILLTGQPTNISEVPPKTYLCEFNPSTNILTIFNQ